MAHPSPLHARLRAATSALHASLDRSLTIAQLPPTVQRVVRHLSACAAWYSPLEQRLHSVAYLSPELQALSLEERDKAAWLRADLARLGAEQPAELCDELPTIDSTHDCWGLLYVLEGATLGGRVLQTRIAEGAPELRTLEFFAGYGTDTATRWREFLAALDGADRARTIDASRAEAAACATFATLHAWLRKQGCTTT